jgi:hypothetical protein
MLLLACGAGGSLRTFSNHGISFRYPADWYDFPTSSNGYEPVYRFAVGISASIELHETSDLLFRALRASDPRQVCSHS